MNLRYEIVRVLDAANLIDCESYERCYRTRDGGALAPGHYVVLWEEAVENPAFDENATYVGPYSSSALASRMLDAFLHSTPLDGVASGSVPPRPARQLI